MRRGAADRAGWDAAVTKLRVSDHALLRFLERGGGVDIEALRDQVSATLQRAADAAATVAAGNYTITVDGLVFVVRAAIGGPVIVTVLDDRGPGPRGHSQ